MSPLSKDLRATEFDRMLSHWRRFSQKGLSCHRVLIFEILPIKMFSVMSGQEAPYPKENMATTKKMLLRTVHPAKSSIPLYTICNQRFII